MSEAITLESLKEEIEDLKHAVVTILREKETAARREYRRLRKRINDDEEGRQMALFGGMADDLEGTITERPTAA